MKISFFEVAQWEKSVLSSKFPDAVFSEEKLMEENVSDYKDSEIISCFIYSALDSNVLSKLENLKLISIRGTGFDNIDQEYCKSHGIKISNVPRIWLQNCCGVYFCSHSKPRPGKYTNQLINPRFLISIIAISAELTCMARRWE